MKKPVEPSYPMGCPTSDGVLPEWAREFRGGKETYRVAIGCSGTTLWSVDDILDHDGLPEKAERFYREGLGLDDRDIEDIVTEAREEMYDEGYSYDVTLKALLTFAEIYGVDQGTVRVSVDPSSCYSRSYVEGYIQHTDEEVAECRAAMADQMAAAQQVWDDYFAAKKQYDIDLAKYKLWELTRDTL